MSMTPIVDLAASLRAQVGRVVVGQEHVTDLLLVALLSGGHVLLEGVPGVGKTLLARTFAACLGMRWGRVQFTPDLMPADILGTNLFNFATNQFALTKGPIFTDFLLADEINRTPPKTQSALLQAMQERVVTLDGKSHELGDGFLVVATQNPIEHEGTYPLPEAQLDRFLFKVLVGYPDRAQECQLVETHGGAAPTELGPALATLDGVLGLRALARTVTVSTPVVGYIVDLVRATRENRSLLAGASPRAAVALAQASRAVAAMDGRDFVIPDDVKAIAEPVLLHRLVMAPGAEIEGTTGASVLREIVGKVQAPR